MTLKTSYYADFSEVLAFCEDGTKYIRILESISDNDIYFRLYHHLSRLKTFPGQVQKYSPAKKGNLRFLKEV